MGKNDIVLVYSGGMDSTTLLYQLIKDGFDIHCMSFDYGQRHRRELAMGYEITKELGVDHQMADLSDIAPFLAGSSQTDPNVEVPEGHYAEESMKLTVVPNRNMIMISIAVGWAISMKASGVYYANHAGDHTIYPDCREEFVAALAGAVMLADWHQVGLFSPYSQISKADIVTRGADMKVPYEKTYSCYKGAEKHCGKCGTCTERIEAFKLAKVKDPTEYEVEIKND